MAYSRQLALARPTCRCRTWLQDHAERFTQGLLALKMHLFKVKDCQICECVSYIGIGGAIIELKNPQGSLVQGLCLGVVSLLVV